MKAAPMTQKPSFPLMKQGDIQNIHHLQMPRWLFADPRYMELALEAKVAYTFLLNRFQLSRLNGWVNEDGAVFIVYTRRSLAEETRIPALSDGGTPAAVFLNRSTESLPACLHPGAPRWGCCDRNYPADRSIRRQGSVRTQGT